MREMIMRRLMFMPGHNEKLLTSATKSDADVLLLDLEDSVQPEPNKAIDCKTINKVIEIKFGISCSASRIQ